jgi:hypothetical protein
MGSILHPRSFLLLANAVVSQEFIAIPGFRCGLLRRRMWIDFVSSRVSSCREVLDKTPQSLKDSIQALKQLVLHFGSHCIQLSRLWQRILLNKIAFDTWDRFGGPERRGRVTTTSGPVPSTGPRLVGPRLRVQRLSVQRLKLLSHLPKVSIMKQFFGPHPS